MTNRGQSKGLTALLYFALTAVAGCVAAIPHPSEVILNDVKDRYPTLTMEELAQDRSVFVEWCTGCHLLEAPRKFPVEEWHAIVEKMATDEEVGFNEQEAEQIARYAIIVRIHWEEEKKRKEEERAAKREARKDRG